MTSNFKDLIIEANTHELHRVIQNGRQKFLCFTKMTSFWLLAVTDGIDIWKREIDEEDLDSFRELAEMNTNESFLNKVRKGFSDGELSVVMIGNKIMLTVGKGAGTLNFDLYEAKAAEKRVELQGILFKLAESATNFEKDLTAANKQIENLKAQSAAGPGNAASAFMDLGSKKGTNPAKVKPKKTGMSAINPTSKKRKAATGVVFD